MMADRTPGEGGFEEDPEDAPASPGDAPASSAEGASQARTVESMLEEITSTKGGETPASGAPRMGKYDQLWQLSMADPHTGLANQLLLLDRLTQALARHRRHGGEVVVCHINLDNLAEINVDLGYATGNTVLCEVSRRLTSVLRAEDTVGRVGASELVVVLTVTDEQAVGPLMRRLQHTLDESVQVDGKDIRLHASLGVAIAEDTESAEEVLSRADRSTRVARR
jgi:diguanylate cyclase (GGDEF)-like protein